MTTSIDNRQRAIQLVEQLPEESLIDAIKLLNNLHKQTNQSQLSIRDQSEEVRKEFARLALQWIQDVEGMSSTVEMTKHPAYQKIVSMGQVIVPFLLEDLHQNPLYWLPALRQITQQNPVQPEQRGKVKQMAEAWLSWGKQEGYIV
ncbi:hypothetical protein H6F42_02820 [Pseudanabaena sp. FACHB-1998]|uniref:hypothetical protein n=1 Tax=Pseudanabaena sp. FACHB-1998 TaxID=2692858 RepID=UPI001680284E|nr:hypothetical protein [Pseudanabaena sp. FACHB-1998]MBD2175851.1 hypothetical protein [Pseudanabaena sp. FACHB-1998]